MIRSCGAGRTMLAWAVLVGMSLVSPLARAHFGGIIIQLQDGYLITGLDNEEPGSVPFWDVRAFGSNFSPAYYSDLPSFLSLRDAPAGTQALPPATPIYWDFLPMTTGGYTSNLLYWNGQGATVSFGPVPVPPGVTDVTMGIYNVTDGGSAIVSDTPQMVPGALLGVTDNTGSRLRLHRHNYYLLDDADSSPATNVAEGVYLIALQLRMPGYGTSRPFFVVPGTFGLVSQSPGSLNTALQWVEENANLLILEGDYNFDGNVDQADFQAWRGQFGSMGPYPVNGGYADGNRNTRVDAADYVVWRKNVGVSIVTGATGGSVPDAAGGVAAWVPEPSFLALFGVAASAWMLVWRKQRRD